jgi:hypothetical protein
MIQIRLNKLTVILQIARNNSSKKIQDKVHKRTGYLRTVITHKTLNIWLFQKKLLQMGQFLKQQLNRESTAIYIPS